MKNMKLLVEMANCPKCGEDLDKQQDHRSHRASSGHPHDRTHTRRPPTPGFNKLGSGAQAAALSRASAFPTDEEEEGSQDNYDRAIDMINAAVEQHNLNDTFDEIADIEGLVGFLQGRYHDFNQAIEQTVRDIIADEMGHEEEEEYRGTEDTSWVAARPINPQDPISRNKPNRSQPKQRHKDAGYQYGDGSATWEEEESSSGYRGKLKSASRIISAKGNEEDWRPQDTSWKDAEEAKQRRRDEERAREEDEEFRGGGKYNRAPQPPEFRGGGKQDRFRLRPRGRNLRDRLQARRRQTYSREPFSVEQEETSWPRAEFDRKFGEKEKFDRKTRRRQTIGGRAAIALARQRFSRARPSLGYEQEEIDWNKEVSRFRNRRKTYEPKFARRPSRLRRRSNSPDSSVFNMQFGQFNEMYRDSQHGLTIDLSGPEGNAFALMGQAKTLAKQLDKDPDAIVKDMQYSDYDHLLDVFEREFGSIITLLNRPGEDIARLRDQTQSDVREPGEDGNITTPPRDSRQA